MNRMESIRAVAAGLLVFLFAPGLLAAEPERAAAVLACGEGCCQNTKIKICLKLRARKKNRGPTVATIVMF